MTGLNVREIEWRYGPLEIIANDIPIGKSLVDYGEWAQVEIALLRQFLAPDAVVYDVGANVGTHAIALASMLGEKGRVFAVEAHPQIHKVLCANVARLGDTRIKTLNLAAGAAAGQACFPALTPDAPQNCGAMKGIDNGVADGSSLRVEVAPLDLLDLPKPDFIKIDTEGAEHDVIKGCARLIAECAPTIYIEFADLRVSSDVYSELSRKGYNCFFFDFPAYNPRNWNANSNNWFGHAHEAGLLFLPPQRADQHIDGWRSLEPIRSLDALISAFVKYPRYGDLTAIERDAAKQGAALRRCDGRATELTTDVQILRVVSQRFRQEQASLYAELVTAYAAAIELEPGFRLPPPPVVPSRLRPHRTLLSRLLRKRISTSNEPAERRLIEGTGLFDARYYIEKNPDVALKGIDPLTHYVRYGRYEGRRPSASFDPGWYLGTYQDVAAAGIDPLIHYYYYGREEGRSPGGVPAPRPVRPTAEQWDALIASLDGRAPITPKVDVIIPVYAGYDDTMACVYSCLTSECRTPYELIIIDDCGPEPELSEALRELGERGCLTYLRNDVNCGFVRTVNRGMTLHPDRDVLLLNSDTVVYGNWLDRIHAHLRLSPQAATVTPFSNNATICSYPRFAQDNNEHQIVDFPELDRIAATANRGQSVEIPTGVGFCMLIRRAALDQVGLFDAETFGMGYGEENDFCFRAIDQGWVNLLAGDVYVRHTGSVSFAGSAAEKKRIGYHRLVQKHPSYEAEIHRHVSDDPAHMMRRRIDLGQLVPPGTSAVLGVSHNWGGGTERHIEDLADRLEAEGIATVMLRPSARHKNSVSIVGRDGNILPNLNFTFPQDLDDFMELLKDGRIEFAHIHSLVGFHPRFTDFIYFALKEARRHYYVTTHDYTPVCPLINMIDGSGVFCGGGHDDVQCTDCVARGNSMFGAVEMTKWRSSYRRLLDGAAMTFAPSADTARRVEATLRLAREVEVRPHFERDRPSVEAAPSKSAAEGPRRVAVIGAVGPHKGSTVLQACAQDALQRSLPLMFVIVGYTDKPQLADLPNVEITGAYHEDQAVEKVMQARCDIAFFPFVWPETFSYALSVSALAGVYPATFDLGAPAERIDAWDWGAILPFSLVNDPAAINNWLLGLTPKPRPQEVLDDVMSPRYDNLLRDYYGRSA